MLSRAIFKAGPVRLLTLVRPVSTSSVVKAADAAPLPTGASVDIFENEKNPLRDHVNFPRRKRLEQPDPVRHWWIPEEYFSFFYPKTGVTGPYMFAVGVGTYLSSKEIMVYEHEFYCGLAFAIVFVGLVHKLSPSFTVWIDKMVDEQVDGLASIRTKEVDRVKMAIEDEQKAQWMAGSYEELISAKKENVQLQMENEYRTRLKDAYTQVKRRLDYQLQTANVLRTNEQKHMVDWIISNVKKSITPKQEEDALKKCVADLKSLAKA